MADFSTIIQEINDDITTNGVGAITGAKLNEVLRDMIAAVNAAKQDPLTIDATPTKDSTNPVQSGGVYEALQDKVDKVQLATTNDIATLGANGNLKDSGVSIGDVAMDANVVHKNGDETISGEKTFADKTIFSTEVKLIDGNEIGATFYSSEEGKIEFYGSPGEGTVQLKNITSPSASSDAATKGYVDGEIAGKQDTISDLSTIRSGAAAGATAYQKPSGGIPASDLAAAVQTSLGKADTALQSYTETDPVFSASPAAGITSGDIADWDDKADPIPVVDASTIPASMEPNKLYKYGTLSGDTVFPSLATPTDQSRANVYWWKFTTPASTINVQMPSAITIWNGGQAPTIDPSTTYEITVEDGFGTCIKS